MDKKKVIIIGAGLAGLSAGCYLQMSGYDTEIFERHNIPGGLLTAWKRKGYTVEGCIHGLLGSDPTHPLYKLWNELIDMDTIKFVNPDTKHLYSFADGNEFVEYASLDKLQQYMKNISPEDSEIIDELINDTKRFQAFQMSYDKPKEFFDLPSKLKMIKALPMLSVINKWMKVSAEDFARKFKNPLLREVTKHFSSPVLFEMFVLSEMDLKRSGYPVIGSLEFARLFEKKYVSCGGTIHYNHCISKITVRKGIAIGVSLASGEEHRADIVVSAIDGRTALFDLLDGKYADKTVQSMYATGELNPSKIQVSLGVDGVLDNIPHTVKVILPSPMNICDGSGYDALDVLVYSDVKELSPVNKTLAVVQLDTRNGDYWIDLRKQDYSRYKAEKQEVGETVLKILSGRIDGMDATTEILDITTPATYERYTGNWKGSIQGWTNENIFKPNPFKKTLPKLRNFYMIGQWVEPGGGIPNVFRSGRDLAQIVCKKDRVKFKTY